MSQQNPPSSREVPGVESLHEWKSRPGRDSGPPPPLIADLSPQPGEDPRQLHVQLVELTAALEDVVALALSDADFRERSMMMHRRAVAALSAHGVAPRPPAGHVANR
jgi:hypothetical protein